jgi:hypothetical protein
MLPVEGAARNEVGKLDLSRIGGIDPGGLREA